VSLCVFDRLEPNDVMIEFSSRPLREVLFCVCVCVCFVSFFIFVCVMSVCMCGEREGGGGEGRMWMWMYCVCSCLVCVCVCLVPLHDRTTCTTFVTWSFIMTRILRCCTSIA
jgi:hypothetical protein